MSVYISTINDAGHRAISAVLFIEKKRIKFLDFNKKNIGRLYILPYS